VTYLITNWSFNMWLSLVNGFRKFNQNTMSSIISFAIFAHLYLRSPNSLKTELLVDSLHFCCVPIAWGQKIGSWWKYIFQSYVYFLVSFWRIYESYLVKLHVSHCLVAILTLLWSFMELMYLLCKCQFLLSYGV
jgi:hypothetical protein